MNHKAPLARFSQVGFGVALACWLLIACSAPDPQPTSHVTATGQAPTITGEVGTPSPSPVMLPSLTRAPITPTQDWRTRPVDGIVQPPDPAVTAGATLPIFRNIPFNVESWNTYSLREAGLIMPVPPGWLVREWPSAPEFPLYYAVTILPPEFAHTDAVQLPQILIAVYRDPLGGSLQDWFAEHSASNLLPNQPALPEGTPTAIPDPNIYFNDVTRPKAMRVGSLPALRFTRDLLGYLSSSTLTSNNGVVIGITVMTYTMTDLQNIYELMLTGIRAVEATEAP